MALRALMLRKKISDAQTRLDGLREKDADFEKREAELEQAIGEAATDEERTATEEAVGAFETEKAEHEQAKKDIEEEVRNLEDELTDVEKEAPKVEHKEERKDVKKMETCEKRFAEMTMEQRTAFTEREEIKEFLERVRTLGSEKRAVTGADLLIPDTMLGLIRHEIARQSRLLPFVRLVNVGGIARQNIAGAIPEAVWTEMCANINELAITFNQMEVDGYKVGGYIAVCNATLADSDINLAAEIISAIGGAIGKALDKAILFGTGTKMPVGIATRLAQTEAPANWGANAPAWTDLHTSNVVKVDSGAKTGAAFLMDVIAKLGIAKPYYNAEGLFWVMNRKTHMDIMARMLAVNSAGAYVADTNLFPIIGGTIVEFEDDEISDYEIIGGYGGNYLMAQREGITYAQSDHVFFLNDMTVFKGTARYDGKPVAGEAFVIVNYNNTDPTTTKTFPVDYANADMNTLTVVAAQGGTTGKTVLTVTNTIAQSSPVLKYAVGNKKVKVGDTATNGWSELTSGSTAYLRTGEL